MKITIPLVGIAGASPLHEFHRPRNTDEKHLDHYIRMIPQVRKGFVGLEVLHDHLYEGTQEENCLIKLTSDTATATISMKIEHGDGWSYNATLERNDGSEPQKFKGVGLHDSKHALVRKVISLIRMM